LRNIRASKEAELNGKGEEEGQEQEKEVEPTRLGKAKNANGSGFQTLRAWFGMVYSLSHLPRYLISIKALPFSVRK
jgi:hypothetical protein